MKILLTTTETWFLYIGIIVGAILLIAAILYFTCGLRFKREKKGKNREGHVILKAYQEGSNIYIEVEDDGNGLNIEGIKERFDVRTFGNEINEEKFHAKISPRENIKKIKDLCVKFIANFDDPNEKNLLLGWDKVYGHA